MSGLRMATPARDALTDMMAMCYLSLPVLDPRDVIDHMAAVGAMMAEFCFLDPEGMKGWLDAFHAERFESEDGRAANHPDDAREAAWSFVTQYARLRDEAAR